MPDGLDAYIYGFSLQETSLYGNEYLFGLDLILDGLGQALQATRSRPPPTRRRANR